MSTGSGDSSKKASVSPKLCPICGKQPNTLYLPFCSKRCADRDLHRWLGEHYAIAGDPAGGAETSSSDGKDGD
jgi:endogenous inhibitor of DNA gyrase (YacG/DUF329 family)